jgi:hypothetical protein
MKKIVVLLAPILLVGTLLVRTAYNQIIASAKDSKMAANLSSRFRASQESILQMYDNLKSWDDVVTALLIAQKAGQDASNVAGMKMDRQSWEDISKKYGLGKDEILREARETKREMEKMARLGIEAQPQSTSRAKAGEVEASAFK